MRLRIYNPEKKLIKQLGSFLQTFSGKKLDNLIGERQVLFTLNEADGELYFPDFFKHMVVAINKKFKNRSGKSGKGVFEASMIVSFEFLKKYGYVNRGSNMRNIRLTNKGSRRNIYHANGECSTSRAQAEAKSRSFDTLFNNYFRNVPTPRSTPTIGQPRGISPGLDE